MADLNPDRDDLARELLKMAGIQSDSDGAYFTRRELTELLLVFRRQNQIIKELKKENE